MELAARPTSATVQDVAAVAGVSPATVSRVLNKSREITPKTRSAVEKAIRELGYQRTNTRRGRQAGVNTAARKDVGSLVLLIPDTHVEAMLTPLTGQLLHGAEAVVRGRGYHLVLSRLSEKDGLSPSLSSIHVDGMIVRGGAQDVVSMIPGVPVVWAFLPPGRPAFGDMVYPDNEEVGRMAARYLLERGHRHIASVNVSPGHPEAGIRLESFHRAWGNVQGDVHPLSCPGKGTEAVADQILGLSPKVTGVFLPLGDAHLLGLVRALEARGVRACDDIELISCNNDRAQLKLLDPRLANIDIQAAEIGRVAAETLLWRMQHPAEHRRCVLIAPLLIAGQDEAREA